MSFDLESCLSIIQSHPYFLKAKQVREVNAAHSEDSVQTHLLSTAELARAYRDGNFIHNEKAKRMFLDFMNREIDGITYKDIAVIVALTHDIGKILLFRENGEIYPMNIERGHTGTTYNPGHEYWGAMLISEILSQTHLSENVVGYITAVVRVHGLIFDYHHDLLSLPLAEAIREMKSKTQGLHLEIMFNSYCDSTYAKPLAACRELIAQMFEDPAVYAQREYFVA